MPSVSQAPSSESRGVIDRSVIDADAFFGAQAFLIKLDSLSQVSSKFITLFFFCNSWSSVSANYYRKIRQRAVLHCTGIFFVPR